MTQDKRPKPGPFWAGTQIPKSTGNAFNVSLAKPSGFDTGPEKAKARRLTPSVQTCDSFKTIDGLSKKAQQALKVPSRRVGISLEKSIPARIPAIPKAMRSA